MRSLFGITLSIFLILFLTSCQKKYSHFSKIGKPKFHRVHDVYLDSIQNQYNLDSKLVKLESEQPFKQVEKKSETKKSLKKEFRKILFSNDFPGIKNLLLKHKFVEGKSETSEKGKVEMVGVLAFFLTAAALVGLAALSFTFWGVGSLGGLLLTIVSLKEHKKHPEYRGKGFPYASLTLIGFQILFVLIVFAIWILIGISS